MTAVCPGVIHNILVARTLAENASGYLLENCSWADSYRYVTIIL